MTTDHAERLEAIEARLGRWLDDELARFSREVAHADRLAYGLRTTHDSPTPQPDQRVSASA